MTATRMYALVRVALAVLTLLAIGTQFSGSLDDPFKSSVMFWSEFTYQSNLLVAIVLLMGAWIVWKKVHPGRWWEVVRGSMVAYTTMTFFVYRFLVKGTSNTPDTGISYYESWASDVLHVVIPIAILLDWLVRPPTYRLSYRTGLIWTVYPIAFCAYSLVRGPIVNWYPYNFLDPAQAGGALTVAMYVIAISLGFLGLSTAVIALGNAMRAFRANRLAHRPQPSFPV